MDFTADKIITNHEDLYAMNRIIAAIEYVSHEDAETMRAIRDRSFDFKAMGYED